MKRFGLDGLVVGVLVAAVAGSLVAKDYYCAPDGTGDYLTSETPGPNPNYCARNLAKTAGDVIHLAAGTYVLAGDAPAVNPQIFLQRGVKVIGATDNPEDTVIDGDGKCRAFCCTYESEVRNLTMRNCATGDERDANNALRGGIGFGGAVCAQSDNFPNYVISNCVVDGCTSIYRGGGGSHGIWYDCVIRNCRVTYEGYKMDNQGNAVDLRSEGSGGGVWAGTLHNCVITNNYAAYAGGGVAGGGDKSDKGYAYNCLIGWNDAGMGGGCGVRGGTDALQCRLYGCTLVSNVTHSLVGYNANKGGGSEGCYLTNCVIRGNQAANEGGGVNRGHAVDCRIEGNVSASNADRGGGGMANGSLVACVVVSNTAVADGGGIFNATATDCVIEDNQVTHVGVSGYGGGGAFGGTLTRCTVRNNRAWFAGAGIYKSVAQDSLIVSNVLTSTGTSGQESTGGAGAYGSVLTDCTVEGNDAGIVFFGGAMNSCVVTNCLVRGNRAPYGGGGYDCDFVACLITNNLAWQRSGGGVYRGTTRNCVIAFNYTTNSVVPEGNKLTGRGAICRGYHVGDLVYSNYYAKGAAVTCGMGDTDITIVNCTVFGNRSIPDSNHNGFNLGCATNCLIYGHPNTDVYNCKALVNCFWQEDMATHGHANEDLTLTRAVDCIHGRNVDPGVQTVATNGVLAFCLRPRSVCRDVGLAFDWMTDAVDLLGAPRVCDKAPDIGAFEYFNPNKGLMIVVR